ncbi:hypothetical protein X279_07470 [Oenococcus oeni IOEB_0501]|nr:hypothetical protein X279_07470 [Oenococcus oeni IOEB_0501]
MVNKIYYDLLHYDFYINNKNQQMPFLTLALFLIKRFKSTQQILAKIS